MRKPNEIKKTLLFIFIPLVIFIIPLLYWIHDKYEENSIMMNNSLVTGKVSSSIYRGYRNIVKFNYVYENKTYTTNEYNFNGNKPLPIGLPIFIQISKNDPESYRLLKDSLVSYNSGYVKYFKKFNGGWTYEILPNNQN